MGRSLFAIKNVLFIFLIISSLISCTPSSNQRRGVSNASDSNTTEDDSETTDDQQEISPFFQYNDVNYPSNFPFPSTFNDTVELKGSFYERLVEDNNNAAYCSVFYFPTIGGGTKLILATLPRTEVNFSDGTKTSFLEISFRSNDSDLTNSLCNNTKVKGVANSVNSGVNRYALSDLCPTCSNTNYRSSNFYIVDSNGNIVTDSPSSNLTAEVKYTTTSNSNVGSCSVNSQCTDQGFSCCLNNQCVVDGELKKTYTSGDAQYSDFIQALIDVASNPINKSKYPEFYFVCGTTPVDDGSDDDDDADDDNELTPQEQAAQFLTELKYLYECTNPVEGEMSICSVKYENITSADTTFQARDDDRDFNNTYTGTNSPPSSIYEIIYQNETIYKDGSYLTSVTDATIAGSNDVLTSAALVTIGKTFDTDSKYDEAVIRYRIDGSCEISNTNIATCFKEYIQGQNEGKSNDHFPPSNDFLLPTYYDTSRSIVVEVDGIKYYETDDYTIINSTPATVRIRNRDGSPGVRVLDTQKVKIYYSVDLNSDPVMASKSLAMQKIGEICTCPANNCNLGEVLDDDGTVVNYQCLPFVEDQPSQPLQMVFQMSSKHVPHLHFDTNGLQKNDLKYSDISNNPINEQEGTEFEYLNSNLRTPNNENAYVGFNEIYGSFTYLGNSALPAKKVDVERNRTYDIFVTDGSISNCDGCGYDYYSGFIKMFPNTLDYSGGGFFPDYSSATKTNVKRYRADEQAFGRSCYVPATMLPWSHQSSTNVQDQRLTRLKTQHFMFANGYQRDWYGFDYGALIGSFDGVKWFAIGDQRRIRAKSNKLYLAFNTYFGDLTLENNTFDILIQDSIINNEIEPPETDMETSGAECQKAHVCEKDSDCAATLGFDYYCADVSNISSVYPVFDQNGREMPNVTDNPIDLFSLVVSNSGSSKRCVYRGRGALCELDHSDADSNTSFHGTDEMRQSACSSNTYCQAFRNLGSKESKFNSKIYRKAKSAIDINSQTSATEFYSTSGLLAPVIGRPFNYIGTEEIDSNVEVSLQSNQVQGMCILGRDNATLAYTTQTFGSINDDSSSNIGDAIHGLGLTRSNARNSFYYLACPAFDEDGNEIKFSAATDTINASNMTLHNSQNISINNITKFSTELDLEDDLVKEFVQKANSEDDDSNPLASGVVFQENMCLRAPGATCFTNLDCAANNVLSGRATSLDSSSPVNFYEKQFWNEELICSQPAKFGEVDYDIRNNRCCRDVNKIITIPTTLTTNTVITTNTDRDDNVDLDNVYRTEVVTTNEEYSKNAVIEYETTTYPTDYPKLRMPAQDTNSGTPTEKLFKTVDLMAKKSCCSENWIREFNSGGHDWRPEKFNVLDTSSLQSHMECFNYYDLNGSNSVDTSTCTTVGDPDCEAISIPNTKANIILKWLSNIELVGIPNVAIQTSESNTNLRCTSTTATTYSQAIVNETTADSEYADYHLLYPKNYDTAQYSTLVNNQTFSEDSFSCCRPAGELVNDGEDQGVCCSGFKNPRTNRCALRNNTNVSLYLNRFISSEANNLPDSSFDPKTGFINDQSKVAEVACFKNLCEEGFLAKGVAYGDYQIRDSGNADIDNKIVKRFIEGPIDNKLGDSEVGIWNYFEDGLKWNNHYYCVSQEVAQAAGTALDVVSCN